jgi:type I restriction enzyme S subunit
VTVRLKVAADLMTSCVSSEVRPFVALEHLESGTGRLVADAEVPERTAPDTGAASVEPGDVLFGKLRPYLAKTWLADRPVFASTELLCLRPRAGVDSRWLAYLVASNPVVEWAVATSDGTKMPRTSWEKLAEYRMQIPPIGDQRSIADYLDRETARIDALIEKKQRMKELLQERRQTLITEAISRSHDPGATARGDAVTTRRLKHLASIAVSNVDKKTVSDERSVRLCNYTDVYYNERITAELPFMEATASADQIASFGLRADDVLLTKDSETPDDIAVPAYVVADLPDVVCGYHLALLRPSQEVDGRYLFWALGSRSSREQFSASANGITRFGLRYDSFGEVLVPLPPIATQRAIADYLDRETARIDALVERIDRQVALLQERRQALITAAVTGELEIPGVAA